MANPNTNQNPFKKHTNEFKDKVTEINADVQDLGKITKNIANDAVDMLRENSTEYYEEGKEKLQKMERNLEGKILENPIRALAIAGAVGLVLGYLWRRK